MRRGKCAAAYCGGGSCVAVILWGEGGQVAEVQYAEPDASGGPKVVHSVVPASAQAYTEAHQTRLPLAATFTATNALAAALASAVLPLLVMSLHQ
jgi:UDP-N-acetylmuramyl tripeptide synthase